MATAPPAFVSAGAQSGSATTYCTVAAPTDPKEIEALAKQGVARVAVPVSAAAGLPAQVRTPDDVLRYGREMIARFNGRRGERFN